MLQIVSVLGICWIGDGISQLLPFPMPGSVIAMLLLFLLLRFSPLKVEHIQEKTDFLLRNMAFFFLPSGVELIAHIEVLRENLLPLLIILFVSTLVTFAVTAVTVRGVMYLQFKFRTARETSQEVL